MRHVFCFYCMNFNVKLVAAFLPLTEDPPGFKAQTFIKIQLKMNIWSSSGEEMYDGSDLVWMKISTWNLWMIVVTSCRGSVLFIRVILSFIVPSRDDSVQLFYFSMKDAIAQSRPRWLNQWMVFLRTL